jgi:hypothetical protein
VHFRHQMNAYWEAHIRPSARYVTGSTDFYSIWFWRFTVVHWFQFLSEWSLNRSL